MSTAMDQREFLESIDPQAGFHLLFEHLPGVSFFVKNVQNEIMRANRHFLERFGFSREEEIVGKTDADLFPDRLAENFRRDDLQVIRSGEAKLNLVELFTSRQGLPDWYITNKLPLRSRGGEVIGVMGTVQSYEGQARTLQPYAQIAPAVDFIRENFTEKISVKELAVLVHLSVRQFDRKFQEAFHTTPQQFIIKMRIQAACDALRKKDSVISEVALQLGFYDQSSFTQHFRKHMGMTPLKYQKQSR